MRNKKTRERRVGARAREVVCVRDFFFCSLFCPLQLILTHSEIAISFWEAGHWPTSSEVRSTDPSSRQQAARREQTVVFDFFACFFELFFFPTSPSLTHSSRSLFLSRPSSPPTCSSPRPAPRSSAEAPSARRQRRCSQAHRQQRGASRRRPFPICRTTTSEFFRSVFVFVFFRRRRRRPSSTSSRPLSRFSAPLPPLFLPLKPPEKPRQQQQQ